MERIEPRGNVLMLNNWLRELALEYGLTDYVLRGRCSHGIYTAVMRWYHTVKDDIANMSVSATLKEVDAKPYMDIYKHAQITLACKKQGCRRMMENLIKECGSIQ